MAFITSSATIDPTAIGASYGDEVRDMWLGTTSRVGDPTTAGTVQGLASFSQVAISGDGRTIAYLYGSLAREVAGTSSTDDLYETGNPSPGALAG